jgi:hypothetical protein
MRLLKVTTIAIALLSVIAMVASFPVQSYYSGKAELIQLVRPSAEAQLFGDVGDRIGSPQMYVIGERSAFLNKSENGAALVDETVLTSKGVYPLQLQTVTYFLQIVRIAAWISLGFAVLVLIVLKKRSSHSDDRTGALPANH